MKHISKGLFWNSLDTLPTDRVFSLLPDLNAGANEIKFLYDRAWIKKDIQTIESLIWEYSVSAEFRFIKGFYEKNVESKNYEKLAMPYFNTDQEDFRGVVQKLTQTRFTKGLIKVFGQKVELYGVTFLNNYYELIPVMEELNITHDEILGLDHSN